MHVRLTGFSTHAVSHSSDTGRCIECGTILISWTVAIPVFVILLSIWMHPTCAGVCAHMCRSVRENWQGNDKNYNNIYDSNYGNKLSPKINLLSEILWDPNYISFDRFFTYLLTLWWNVRQASLRITFLHHHGWAEWAFLWHVVERKCQADFSLRITQGGALCWWPNNHCLIGRYQAVLALLEWSLSKDQHLLGKISLKFYLSIVIKNNLLEQHLITITRQLFGLSSWK